MGDSSENPAAGQPPALRPPLRWFRGDHAVDPDRAQAAFDRQHKANEFSTRVHLFFACLGLFVSAGPTSASEIGWAIVGGCAILRLNYSWRTYRSLLAQPTLWVLAAFGAWQFAAIGWSSDTDQAIQQAGAMRFALIPLGLWPVIDRRGWLIAAYASGWVAGWLTQLGQGLDLITFPRDATPDRISGWWDPALSGTLLMVPLGLHLAGLAIGRGRWRIVAATGLALTVVAIIATGTRGAWLSGLALISITTVFWFARSKTPAKAKLAALALVVLAATTGGFVLRANIASRFDEARTALQRITEEGDYETSTGRRVLMYEIAWDAFTEAPLAGQGTGDFEDYWRSWNERNGREGIVLAHAHCAPLHIAATTGAIGLLLVALALATIAAGAIKSARASPTASGYHAGPALALTGLLLISVFDSVHINSQSAMQLGVIAALCPWWLPKQRAIRNEPA